MIDYQRSAPGSWSIDLHPSTPHRVTQAIDVATHGFSTFVVTPTRVDTVGMVTDAATLHSLCTYAGLLRAQGNRLALSGPGLWAALGNEKGDGPIIGAGLSATRTIRAWVQSLDLAPFITADSALDNGAGFTWTSDRVMTYREALESIIDSFWTELFIDPRDMLIKDTGVEWTHVPSQVYGPYPLLTPWYDGREVGESIQLVAATFDVRTDLDEWVSDVSFTDATTTATTGGTIDYSYAGGTAVDVTRYVSDTSTPGGYGTSAASQILDTYNEETQSVVASTDDMDLLSYIVPGSVILAYDPENGIYDSSAWVERLIRGQMMRAMFLTVQSMRVPITAQNGVYVVTWDGAADVIVDLSEHFIPETGAATLELGRTRHRAIRTQARRDGARRQ